MAAVRARILARLSVALSFTASAERRLALAEQSVALARGVGDPLVLAGALAAHCDAIAGPDDTDRREAAFARRLDLLTRQVERLERDLTIAVEALALFIRFWLIVTPSLPESAQAAAQAKGRERFDAFLETLGRRLAKGRSLLREVSIDKPDEGFSRQSETTGISTDRATAPPRPSWHTWPRTATATLAGWARPGW